MNKARQIQSKEDIDAFTYFLLPRHIRRAIDEREVSLCAVKHPIRIMIEYLWNERGCCPVREDKICQRVTEERAWSDSDQCSTPPTALAALGFLYQRLEKVRQRMNKRIARSPWRKYVFVANRNHWFRLVVQPEEAERLNRELVAKAGQRGERKSVEMEVLASRRELGLAVLKANETFSIRLTSDLTGYLRVFHIDFKRRAEEVFPDLDRIDPQRVKKWRVRRGEEIEMPKEILDGAKWRATKTPGVIDDNDELIAIVTRSKVRVTVSDIRALGFCVVPKRVFRGMETVQTAFLDLPFSSTGVGSVKYEVRE
ncbi:MAG: DUF4384 domain-containing protein [Kiritimatiellae bacterium]|nr:DUF4384 domain-containing protein [Kiritimatiellia bacterium]